MAMETIYKNNSEIAQEKINQIIFDHKLVESEIAHALGITPQNLSYQLHQSSNFDREIEKGIYIYFRSKGIIQYQKGHCEVVTENFLEFTSIIHHQIAILSNHIKRSIADDMISKDEQDRLIKLVDTLTNDLLKQLNELKSSVMGLKQ